MTERAPESVWDYPRPPRLERDERRVRVVFNGETIADTTGAYRVLETSHPPTFYLPPDGFVAGALEPAGGGGSLCEWKGRARYFDIVAGGKRAERAAWAYPDPTPAFAAIKDHIALYPQAADACFVGEERVQAQEGGFYGGWITSEIRGPFKGAPGTWGW